MKILHTSDWHLGRSLHGADLGSAQEAFVDHLVEVVTTESVNVVAIAGDVYDRAIPPVHAVALLEDALARIRSAGAQVIAISGNHDSAARLGFGSSLMTAGGVHLRTDAAKVAAPVLVGDVGFYCLPYLEPDAVRSHLPADPAGATEELGRSHEAVTSRAMDCVRADAAARGLSRRVVLAHGWVTGGESCASERDISVGGVGSVPTSLFDGIDYVALGHLHGQQTLDAHLRYSGSPVAYSFSESNHRKGSWLVELEAGGLATVTAVPAPVHRGLAVITGTVDELLSSRNHDAHESSYVSAVATDEQRPVEPMERLRSRFPHILTFQWVAPEAAADPRTYAQRVRGKSDLDLALDFVAHVRSPAESDEEDLLTAALSAGLGVEESAA